MNSIVIYKSRYGSSRQYALWLAQALQCRAETEVELRQLQAHDIILYVGGLYVGSINGFGRIRKHLGALQKQKLILCAVGMTNPEERDTYAQLFHKNVPEEYRESVKCFALHGDQLFSKMSCLHRTMMRLPKKEAEKIPEDQRTEENRRFLESYGRDVYFSKQENIAPVVAYARGLPL